MTQEQQDILFQGIKDITYEDAKAIDSLAKTLNISQNYIYRLFIEFHELMFSILYKEDNDAETTD